MKNYLENKYKEYSSCQVQNKRLPGQNCNANKTLGFVWGRSLVREPCATLRGAKGNSKYWCFFEGFGQGF